MNLDTLISVLTYLALLSATVERVVQFLKSVSSLKLSTASTVVVQSVAVLVGVVLAYLSPSPTLATFFTNHYVAVIATGFLGSSGAGAWHDILGILQNFKSGKV